eukprot:3678676-Pyramimonas_sp.AAC.1
MPAHRLAHGLSVRLELQAKRQQPAAQPLREAHWHQKDIDQAKRTTEQRVQRAMQHFHNDYPEQSALEPRQA